MNLKPVPLQANQGQEQGLVCEKKRCANVHSVCDTVQGLNSWRLVTCLSIREDFWLYLEGCQTQISKVYSLAV